MCTLDFLSCGCFYCTIVSLILHQSWHCDKIRQGCVAVVQQGFSRTPHNRIYCVTWSHVVCGVRSSIHTTSSCGTTRTGAAQKVEPGSTSGTKSHSWLRWQWESHWKWNTAFSSRRQVWWDHSFKYCNLTASRCPKMPLQWFMYWNCKKEMCIYTCISA